MLPPLSQTVHRSSSSKSRPSKSRSFKSRQANSAGEQVAPVALGGGLSVHSERQTAAWAARAGRRESVGETGPAGKERECD